MTFGDIQRLTADVDMTGESLAAFSRITEDCLFFEIGCNWRPRVRKSFVCKIIVHFLLSFKLLHYVTISNDDVTRHIQHGNFFVGLTF